MSIWVQISAGQGPSECCLAVARISEMLIAEASKSSTPIFVLDQTVGEMPGTYQSIILSLGDQEPPEWLAPWLGTIQWISQSPYRPRHPRKNWFVAVHVLEQKEPAAWSLADVRIDTFRSSGPGGQHVNKTETGVRATHSPTGLMAVAQDGRSQHENRRLAIERLQIKLQTEEERRLSNTKRLLWKVHSNVERGNAVKIFKGINFLN